MSSIHSTQGDFARPEFRGFAVTGRPDLAFSSEAGNATKVLAQRARTSCLERFDAIMASGVVSFC